MRFFFAFGNPALSLSLPPPPPRAVPGLPAGELVLGGGVPVEAGLAGGGRGGGQLPGDDDVPPSLLSQPISVPL